MKPENPSAFPCDTDQTPLLPGHGEGIHCKYGFFHEGGSSTISLTGNSNLPHLSESALYPVENLRLHPEPDANAVADGTGRKSLIFNNETFFARSRVPIDYTSGDMRIGTIRLASPRDSARKKLIFFLSASSFFLDICRIPDNLSRRRLKPRNKSHVPERTGREIEPRAPRGTARNKSLFGKRILLS